MSLPPTGEGASYTTRVLEARINNVNVSDFTVDVTTVKTMQHIFDLPIGVGYTHYFAGEGNYFMPDVGALCWICFPSDNTMPFVLSFSAPHEEGTGSFRANRKRLEMGEQILQGRANNFVWLRKGGVLELQATALARRMYIPIDNMIRDIAQNYKMHTVGGVWEWTVAKKAEDPNGKAPVKFLLGVKEFANDPGFIAQLEIAHAAIPSTDGLLSADGSVKSDVDLTAPLVRFRVFSIGGGPEVTTLEIERNGDVKYTVGSLTIESLRDIALTSSTGNVKIDAAIEVMITAKVIKMVAPLIDIKSSLIKLGAGISISVPTVGPPVMTFPGAANFGPPGTAFGLLKASIIQPLSSHTHTDSVGGVTTAPLNSSSMTDVIHLTNLLRGA